MSWLDRLLATINGVLITGTPSAGQVPTATSSTTGVWANQALSEYRGITIATKSVTHAASPVTGTSAYDSYACASSGGTTSVRLPPPTTVGSRVKVYDADGSAGTSRISIDGNGYDVFGPVSITSDYGSLEYLSDGVQWYCVSAVRETRDTEIDAYTLWAYDLSEPSGTTFANRGSATASTLTLSNAGGTIALGTGGIVFGSAPHFSNTSLVDAIKGAGAVDLSASLTTQMSVSALVYRDGTADGYGGLYPSFVSKSAAAGQPCFALGYDPSGYLRGILKTTASDYALASTYAVVPRFRVSLVSMTFDGSYQRIYLNGREVGKQAATGTVLWNTTYDLYIGNYELCGASENETDGSIQSFRLENTVRSASYYVSQYNRAVGAL